MEARTKPTSQFERFIVSVQKGNQKDVELLLEAKDRDFDINEKDKNGYTALIYAAVTDNRNLVNLLLSKGADLYLTSTNGIPVTRFFSLFTAAEAKQMPVIHGANHQTSALIRYLLLHNANSERKLTKLLIANGAEREIVLTAVMKYQIGVKPTCLFNLLGFGFVPEVYSAFKFANTGKTLLMIAAATGNINYIVDLVKHSDINAKDSLGQTALVYAAKNGLGVQSLLKTQKIEVNARCANGMTAFMYAAILACSKNQKLHNVTLNNLEALLKAGADPKIVDNKYKNALIHALEKGLSRVDVFNVLASSKEICNTSVAEGGRSTLIVAVQYCSDDIVYVLLQKCSSVLINQPDKNGKTPLMYAAERGDIGIARLLLHWKADPKLVDKSNKVARDYLDTTRANYLDLVKSFPTKSLASIQSAPVETIELKSAVKEKVKKEKSPGFLDKLFKPKSDKDYALVRLGELEASSSERSFRVSS